MKLLSHQRFWISMFRPSKGISCALATLALSLGLSAASQAAPITGEELAGSSSFSAPSTNALNFAQLVPGREGQVAPYVLLDTFGPGSVTLDFFNYATAGIAFFEYRLDGVSAGTTPHPGIPGDVIHPGVFVANQADIEQTFLANSYVEIRLALGGERDWDFDWTRFEVGTNAVPEPGTLALVGLSLLGMAAIRRRRIR